MPGFRRLSEHQLDGLSDDELVDYIRRARAEGELVAMRTAIQVLAYGSYDEVHARVRMKMQSQSDADVEMVTDEVVGGAMLAAFRGESVGEFRALVTRILKRRVADYYRSSRSEMFLEPLAAEHEGEEGVWGNVPVDPEDEVGAVWAADLLERTLAELSPAHRAAVEHRLAGHSSKEAAELVNNHLAGELERPMTADNVDQINSRFRRDLNDLILEAERGGTSQDPSEEDDG